MQIYCTICCGKKNQTPEPIPARRRYYSERIADIFEKSFHDDVQFRILSAKYGLLKPEDKIPYYDQKLITEQIPVLSEIVKAQLIDQNISVITFFKRDSNKYPDWKPDISLLEEVCNELDISLILKKVEQ